MSLPSHAAPVRAGGARAPRETSGSPAPAPGSTDAVQLRGLDYDEQVAALRPGASGVQQQRAALAPGGVVQMDSDDGVDAEVKEIQSEAAVLTGEYIKLSREMMSKKLLAKGRFDLQKMVGYQKLETRFDGLKSYANGIYSKADSIHDALDTVSAYTEFVGQMRSATKAAQAYHKDPENLAKGIAWAKATAGCFGKLGPIVAPLLKNFPMGGYVTGLLSAPEAYINAMTTILRDYIHKIDRAVGPEPHGPQTPHRDARKQQGR